MKKNTLQDRRIRLEAIQCAYDAVEQQMRYICHTWEDSEYRVKEYDELGDEEKHKYDVYQQVLNMINELE